MCQSVIVSLGRGSYGRREKGTVSVCCSVCACACVLAVAPMRMFLRCNLGASFGGGVVRRLPLLVSGGWYIVCVSMCGFVLWWTFVCMALFIRL
jgi:hypothetical protein